ncbi:unnamed protein product [Trichogramma brassicae]|uniref:Uncharacterized protein n=1 Tax=Trichogramma brassicae TaxID=86971 RepID=A0A6H5I2V6_9HYME|nr:unnamed protein product [Trichogramma brassicae]
MASEALATLDSLENRGYELDQSSALTVMKFFAKHGLLETSPDLEKCWYDEEEFVTEAKEIMVKPDLSLYDLVQLQPVEAAKLITCKEYSELARLVPWDRIKQIRHQWACVLHLLEKISRGFFWDWAIESFMELTKYRLPLEKLDVSSDGFWTNVIVKIAIWLTHDAILRQVQIMANDIVAIGVNRLNKQIDPDHIPFTYVNLSKMNNSRLFLSLQSLGHKFAADEYHPHNVSLKMIKNE